MSKNYLILIIFLILISSVVAVKPDTQVFVGSSGLEIAYPLVDYAKIGVEYYPHFHIFNASNGYGFKEGDLINCTLDIYDPQGDEIFEGWNSTFDNMDILISLSGKEFNETGIYSYVVYCEDLTTNEGGFINSQLIVNEIGKEKKETALWFILIMIGIVSIGAYTMKDNGLSVFAGVLTLLFGLLIMRFEYVISGLLNQTFQEGFGLSFIFIGFYIVVWVAVRKFFKKPDEPDNIIIERDYKD